MSSTLYVRKTPTRAKEWHFKLPVKAYFGRQFYGHDGTLGGGPMTVDASHLDWLDGVLAAFKGDDKERRDLEQIADHLREGGTVDIWFEV